MAVKSDKIRRSARDQSCTLRIPGVCCHNDSTVVLAHIGRRRGMGIKCADYFAVYACHSCHDEIDGRTNNINLGTSSINPDVLSTYKLDALEETQERLIEQGLLEVK